MHGWQAAKHLMHPHLAYLAAFDRNVGVVTRYYVWSKPTTKSVWPHGHATRLANLYIRWHRLGRHCVVEHDHIRHSYVDDTSNTK
jgi:hypothetical protein